MATPHNSSTTWRSVWLILVACTLPMVAGCESQPVYAECKLDPEVLEKGVCTGNTKTETGNTSCVVTKHPNCTDGVCLSYFGTQSICTMPCTLGATTCPEGGFCWSFAEGESYCVPADRQE